MHIKGAFLMNDSPAGCSGIHQFFYRPGNDDVPGGIHHKKDGEENMKKSTIVVLEKGNDCAFEGPMNGCCITALMPI
jgi:hypothetical protein